VYNSGASAVSCILTVSAIMTTVYPQLCRKCDALGRRTIPEQCHLCRDLAFDERVLCDLTRSIQNREDFACHAFRPLSRLRLSSVRTVDDRSDDQKSASTPGGVDADHLKYREALAMQRLRTDPDTVSVDLKYHLVWNVAHRKPIFDHSGHNRVIIDEVFVGCGDRIGGSASVLWLAPDHIHVYFESDGEKSIETVVKVLKRVSLQRLRAHLAPEVSSSRKNRVAWDKAYFAETIG
jgi:REP element-mobilizing transposase RayT